jgi:uncharacterized Ntn-hydrolase superfamily protein
MFGIAVSSSSPAVAARCAHAQAGVGAVATQNITDPTLGFAGLRLMASGHSAQQALAQLRTQTHHIAYRQLALLDRDGAAAGYSGEKTLGTHAIEQRINVIAAGNLLRSEDIPRRMIDAFVDYPDAELGDRMIAAMRAAVAAGGEEGPVHSAGLLLVRDVEWPIADLRIDWHETDPIGALADLWLRWKPQMEVYVLRARDPACAPAFGVPGDR